MRFCFFFNQDLFLPGSYWAVVVVDRFSYTFFFLSRDRVFFFGGGGLPGSFTFFYLVVSRSATGLSKPGRTS